MPRPQNNPNVKANELLSIDDKYKIGKNQKNKNNSPKNNVMDIGDSMNIDYGICCFCREQCNPASQSCGKCLRSN